MENAVSRTKLQLVGVTALLIACKYEEIYPPEVRDCVYITDNAYTRGTSSPPPSLPPCIAHHARHSPTLPPFLPPSLPTEEVLKMEQKILKHFGFRVSMPTMHGFLVRFLKIGEGGHLCSPRAFYFAERALQVRTPPPLPPSLPLSLVRFLKVEEGGHLCSPRAFYLLNARCR